MKNEPFTWKNLITGHSKIALIGTGLFVAVGLLYFTSEYFKKDYTETRFYERWGLYTPKLTLEQWNRRIQPWTPKQVRELLGDPLQETSNNPEVEFYWKYKLRLKSDDESGVVTSRDVYVRFLLSQHDQLFYSIGVVEHRPD